MRCLFPQIRPHLFILGNGHKGPRCGALAVSAVALARFPTAFHRTPFAGEGCTRCSSFAVGSALFSFGKKLSELFKI